MKIYTKKGFLTAIILICAFALLFSFSACAQKNEIFKTITLIIGEGENQMVFESYETLAENLSGVLEELKAKGKITYTVSESAYGEYIKAINSYEGGESSYLCLLSTVEEQQDITSYAIKRTVSGREYVSVNYGISSLKIIDGAGYLIIPVNF